METLAAAQPTAATIRAFTYDDSPVAETLCAYRFVAIAPPATMVLPSTVTVLPGCVPEKANADELVPPKPTSPPKPRVTELPKDR
jgi:hypothetical protein